MWNVGRDHAEFHLNDIYVYTAKPHVRSVITCYFDATSLLISYVIAEKFRLHVYSFYRPCSV